MHIFEMFSSERKEPLTVFATDLLHAERIYSEWIDAHHADWPSEAMVNYPYMGRWLHCRPELYAASKCAEAGVGVWDAERSQWAVCSPERSPEGCLARSTGINSYYRVASPGGDELMVFAPDIGKAALAYDEWHGETWAGAAEGMIIKEKSRWLLVLSLGRLRDEMDAGVTGAARWDPDEGWRIVRPEFGTVLPDHMR